MAENSNKIAREKRGFVSQIEIKSYATATSDELGLLLRNGHSQERTIAATLIGRRKLILFIPQLCLRLCTERSLYPRIAASEALGEMGEAAVEPLIAILGKIGDNQEYDLPVTWCKKKSFPLARDLAARTLVKIGRPALMGLISQVQSGAGFETQQAIDAIGGIVSKTKDYSPSPILLQVLTDYPINDLIIWKVVRALSTFRCDSVITPLLHILSEYPQPAIRWEAARSLGQIGIGRPEVIEALQNAMQNDHSEVKTAAEMALNQLTEGSE